MAVGWPQADNRGLSGGADAWDDGAAGAILSADYFATGSSDYAAAGAVAVVSGAAGDPDVTAPTPPTYATLVTYASTANVTTSGAVAVGTAVPTGKVISVSIACGAAAVVTGVSDSQGNTWTQEASVDNSVGAASTTTVWTAPITTALGSGDTITVTRTTSGGLAWIAHVWSDIDTGDPFGTPVTAAASAASDPSCGTLTVPTDGAGFVAVGFANATSVSSWGSGLTSAGGATSSGGGNPRQIQTAGATATVATPSADLASNGGWGIIALPANPVSAGPNDYAAAGTIPATSGVSGKVKAQYPADVRHARIGDSTTYRSGTTSSPPSREATTRAFDELAGFTTGHEYWYGVGGKTMLTADSSGNTTADNIADAVTYIGGPLDFWVIGLGTNDVGLGTTAFEAAVNSVLDDIAAAGGGHVLWVNLAFYNVANTNATTYNPVLDTVAAARPDEMTVLDFNTWIHSGPIYDAADWIYPTDSTHMTVQGWAKRDDFIRGALLEAFDSYLVAGTAPATSTVTGNATVTPTSTDYPASGTVAAVSAASGTVGLQQPASGTVAAASSTDGTVTANLAVSGTVSSSSSVSGNVTVTSGPVDYPASGTVTAVSGVTGDAVRATPVSGSVTATSGQSGTVTANYAVSGTVGVVSGQSGTIALRQAVGGRVDVVSTTAGQVTASYAVAGVVPVVSAVMGDPDVTLTTTSYRITGSGPTTPTAGGGAGTHQVGGTVGSRRTTAGAGTHALAGSGPGRTLTGGA